MADRGRDGGVVPGATGATAAAAWGGWGHRDGGDRDRDGRELTATRMGADHAGRLVDPHPEASGRARALARDRGRRAERPLPSGKLALSAGMRAARFPKKAAGETTWRGMAERLLIIDDDARLAAMVSDCISAPRGFPSNAASPAGRVSRRSSAQASTPSSSTSCCPTSTDSSSAAGSAPAPRRRS